jgi:hypothetical protein
MNQKYFQLTGHSAIHQQTCTSFGHSRFKCSFEIFLSGCRMDALIDHYLNVQSHDFH